MNVPFEPLSDDEYKIFLTQAQVLFKEQAPASHINSVMVLTLHRSATELVKLAEYFYILACEKDRAYVQAYDSDTPDAMEEHTKSFLDKFTVAYLALLSTVYSTRKIVREEIEVAVPTFKEAAERTVPKLEVEGVENMLRSITAELPTQPREKNNE